MSGHPPPRHPSDLAERDALLADRQSQWWDAFYADRARPVPFFGASPDESLYRWTGSGAIPRGRALDLGCGNGRNAIFLARSGFTVEGIDYSRAAIEWAEQRAGQAGVEIRLHHASVFELQVPAAGYDLVYDSGCFHHLPPHRRSHYVAWVAAALKPGGRFAMACFRPEGGSGLSDDEVYERRTLGGGLGYTDKQLHAIWSGPFEICELRQMQQPAADSDLFGAPFLWAMLARRI